MTAKRLTIAAGGVAILALLVVGLVELSSSSPSLTRPSKLTLARMRARPSGSPPELASLHARASDLRSQYIRQGAYPSKARLEEDVRRYAPGAKHA